jgi:hypothetical protein
MPTWFYKFKLLLDENMPPRQRFPRLNSRFDREVRFERASELLVAMRIGIEQADWPYRRRANLHPRISALMPLILNHWQG